MIVKKLHECEPYLQEWQEDKKIRWENDTREDLRIIQISNWTECIQDQVKWKEVVEKAKTFKQ